MSRARFARARPRDERGRFLKLHRPNRDMLICTQRGTVRPMAVVAKGKGLKGLLSRLLVALSILKSGQIPILVDEQATFPYGNVTRFLTSDRFEDIAPSENDRYET